ncbi:MAG: hypothetical protein M3Q24_01410 [bacterium]|nr:hypothetical protein [bacterium]
MKKFKKGLRDFVVGLIKATAFIAGVVLFFYLCFVTNDFIKTKFDIDLSVPGGIIFVIFIFVTAVAGWYHRIINLFK